MKFESDNTPCFRTIEEAYGRGARLHVPRNPWHKVTGWIYGFILVSGVAVFSILSVLAILIMGLMAMDFVLSAAEHYL